ncbi:MAG TPA: hypothetical protein VIV63_13415, partial [Steroidobacteraceae bacterium]
MKPRRGPTDTVTTAPRPPPPPPPPDRSRDLVAPTRTPPPRDREPAAEERSAEPNPESTNSAPPAALSDPGVPEAPAAKPANALKAELLVASQDVAESDAQRAWMQSQGAQLLRRRTLSHLGWVLSVYRLSPGASASAVKAALLQQWPDSIPENNERYQALGESAAAPAEYAGPLIHWPVAGCGRRPRIAMLDGPVNTAVAALAGARVQSAVFTPAGQPNYHHGTSVAAVLVGGAMP